MIQDLHKLLTCDRLMFIKIFRKFMQLADIVFQQLFRFVVCLTDQGIGAAVSLDTAPAAAGAQLAAVDQLGVAQLHAAGATLKDLAVPHDTAARRCPTCSGLATLAPP